MRTWDYKGEYKLPEFVLARLPAIQSACLKYRVKNLWLYGSAVTPRYQPRVSDLDFMVDFTPEAESLYDGPNNKTIWPFGFPETLQNNALPGNYRGLQAALGTIFQDYLTTVPNRGQIDLGQYEGIRNEYIKNFIDSQKLVLYESQ